MRDCRPGWGRWRPARAVHDPRKIVADLAVTLALGGDCLADIAMLRAEPGLFGPVVSDPGGVPAGLRPGRRWAACAEGDPGPRAAARERAWALRRPGPRSW